MLSVEDRSRLVVTLSASFAEDSPELEVFRSSPNLLKMFLLKPLSRLDAMVVCMFDQILVLLTADEARSSLPELTADGAETTEAGSHLTSVIVSSFLTTIPPSDCEKMRVICGLQAGSSGTAGEGVSTCGTPGFKVTAGSGADLDELDFA